MHLSRVYCLLPGPPTTSQLSNVQHSGLVSMQLCDCLRLLHLISVCSLCTRDQGVWLTRGDLRTRVTGMAGNGSEQSLCPKILGSVQIWCLTGCVSDDYKGTGNRDQRSLAGDQLIHHSPRVPWSRHRWCQPLFLSRPGYCNVLPQLGHFNCRVTLNR